MPSACIGVNSHLRPYETHLWLRPVYAIDIIEYEGSEYLYDRRRLILLFSVIQAGKFVEPAANVGLLPNLGTRDGPR